MTGQLRGLQGSDGTKQPDHSVPHPVSGRKCRDALWAQPVSAAGSHCTVRFDAARCFLCLCRVAQTFGFLEIWLSRSGE